MTFDRDRYVPGRPFTLNAGLSAGLTRHQLAGSAFRHPHRNIYVDATTPDTMIVRARAARLALPPDAVFSHWTAMRLWIPSARATSATHVSFGRNAYTNVDKVIAHRFTYPIKPVYRHGLPITSGAQTFVHMAVILDLVDLVALGDGLVRRGATTPEDLRRWCRDWTGHGGRAARAAAGYVRRLVDSAPETRLRLLFVLAGLPEPVVNHSILVDGVERYRLDLAYVEQKLAIEYDGRWHDQPEQRLRDATRRDHLRQLGWTVIVVRAEGLYEDPDATLGHVLAAMIEHGVPTPAQLDEAYRPFFLPSWSVASEPAGPDAAA